MKKIIFILLAVLTFSCQDEYIEEFKTQIKEPLTEASVSSTSPNDRTGPFRYNFLKFNGMTREGMLNWEGDMFDYNKDGIPDMVSTGTTIKIVSDISNDTINPYKLIKSIELSDFIKYDKTKLWTSQGVVYDFNNDGKMDHFIGLVGEGPGVWNRGGTYLILSDGNSYKGSVIDSREMFRFDDTFTLIDYNRDGYMDVLTDFEFTLYQNNKDGTFKIIDNPFPRLTKNPGWLQTRVDDLNGDGYADIIGIAFHGLEIHYGTSDYTKFNSWYKEWEHLKDWKAADVTITNIDNRGYKEILVTYSNWQGGLYMRIFKYTVDGYYMDLDDPFHTLTRAPSWDQETKTTAFDFDNDGDDDIFFQQINYYTNYFFENVNGSLVKKILK